MNPPIHQGDLLLERTAALLGMARESNFPIIYVLNEGGDGDPDRPGTPGYEIHPALEPLAAEPLVSKRTPDSFLETGLQRMLDDFGVTSLVIAGRQSEYCIDTTCRSAWRLGYDVILVSDGHSTWDSGQLSADQIIAHHNRVLGGFFVTLAETSEVAFDL